MVYEVSDSLELSQKKVQSLSERCQEFILKSACIDGIKKTYILPILEYHGKEGIDIENDPVTLARSLLRQGGILCALLNVFRGGTISKYTEMPENINIDVFVNKSSLDNIDLFLTACRDDLFWLEEQLFDKKALYTEDTNVLAKAIAMTDKFFDKMRRVQKMNFDLLITKLRENEPLFAGKVILDDGDDQEKLDTDKSVKENRLKAIAEILSSERQYVADLEKLQHYSEELRIDNIISPDYHVKIFSNLDQLVDFQRKFLLLVEGCIKGKVITDLQASYDAHIGLLFSKNESAFKIYETFCGNHKQSLRTVEFLKQTLKKKERVMNPEVVPSYLIKPVQRVCRYPLLLREVIKSSAKDAPDLDELEEANNSMKRITEIVNERQRREENVIIATEFKTTVSDWKIGTVRIDPGSLGALLFYEVVTIVQKKSEKELSLYLFENALLMCSETKSIIKSSKFSWTIKGAIYSKQITGVSDMSQESSGIWSIQVAYRSYDTEYLVIKFINQEKVKLWMKMLNTVIIPVKSVSTAEESIRRRRSIISMIKPSPSTTAIASAAPSTIEEEAISIEAIRVKVTYEGETYIVFCKEIESLEMLIEKALEKIKSDWILLEKEWNLTSDHVRLKYRDNQGDLINLCNDEDLDIAMSDCTQHIMSIVVTRTNSSRRSSQNNDNLMKNASIIGGSSKAIDSNMTNGGITSISKLHPPPNISGNSNQRQDLKL